MYCITTGLKEKKLVNIFEGILDWEWTEDMLIINGTLSISLLCVNHLHLITLLTLY